MNFRSLNRCLAAAGQTYGIILCRIREENAKSLPGETDFYSKEVA